MKNIKSQMKTIFDLDKSTWDVVRFGDVAFNISERVEPHDTDAETYVGLEHLDTNSIHIRRKGKPGDVKGTKLKVYKGDIIFGKRRAYQRKAAISDFDGICSAHAMVLRANPKIINPDLFPFFIHSDVFMNRAIEVSEGSLSPTIKWKILAEQKFYLPPIELQTKMAELLWTIDGMSESYHCLLMSQKKFFQTWFSKKLKECNLSSSDKPLSLYLVDKPKYGASLSASPYILGKPRYIRITDIDENGGLYPDGIVGISTDDYQKYILSNGDVLISRTADPGKVFVYDQEKHGVCVYAGYLIKFRFDSKKLLPAFFLLYSKSADYWRYINETIKTGTVSNINAEEFKKLPVPGISLQEQKNLIVKAELILQSISDTKLQQIRSGNMRSSLINSIF